MVASLAIPFPVLTKDSGEDDYRRNIRANVRGLWGNKIDVFSFMQSMNQTIYRGLTRAFYAGAQQMGIYPEDLTMEERNQLNQALIQETNWVVSYANTIVAARDSKKKLGPLLDRAEMWVLRYESFRSWAMTLVGQDGKLMWQFGPTEHCTSCARLNGRVYRASVWRRYNIYPRNRALECGGWRCQCRLIPTSDRVTPGRPPAIP